MDSDDYSWLYRAVDEWEENQQQLDGDGTDEQLCRALADFEIAAAAAAAVVRHEISDSPADVENTTAG